MDSSQIEALVQRLVLNPHDEEALAYAHQAGAADPKSYALILERVGTETRDAGYASHWLSEAANVWALTMGDAHRAARVLMQAIERDPTQQVAADRLAQLYREKGDVKALVALLEHRAKALAPLASTNPERRAELATMHEELGRLWSESLQQPKKALENYRRALDLGATSPYAIYGAREIYKSLGQWEEAFRLYDAELATEQDPARKVALLRDEAATRRAAGDLAGASRALGRARQIDAQDSGLQQEYGSAIVERVAAGENVPATERTLAAELLVGLAEAFDGEHGLAYSAGALDIEPGHDRALQLYAHYARALKREDDVASRYLAYITANPQGASAAEARWLLAGSYEAADQLENAIQILEPLRGQGDANAAAKLRELYPRVGRSFSAAPPPPPPQATSRPPQQPARSPGDSSLQRMPAGLERPQTTLDAAQALASRGQRAEAYTKYRAVLEGDPAHPEALSWVEDYLRSKRDYAALRDVLLGAVRAPGEPLEARQERLREVAGLCEGNLRDADGAIGAWRQLLAIDRSDESARQALTRLLEKSHRWDDLANLLEQEATSEVDLEKKIVLEKKIAALHEHKRRDFGAAAEAWARIANLTPEDERAISTASSMFEKAGSIDRAAAVIAENAEGVSDTGARATLLERLGQLREDLNDPAGAGAAYAEAADIQEDDALWESAERCFVAAERWDRAGASGVKRAELGRDPKQQAAHFARSADYFGRAGDEAALVTNLDRAIDLDPIHEDYARILSERYTAAARWGDLVSLLVKRGDRLADAGKRVALRRRAAVLYATELQDKEAARETWLRVLEDGDDKEALDRLIDDALDREDHEEAAALLRRLEDITPDRAEKARIALREAELLAEGIGDVDEAIARYERVLADLDPASLPALQAIADLQEARDNPAAAADALERELKLVDDPNERGPIAGRLARLYEQLEIPEKAIVALQIVRESDPEDFDALTRLCELSEKTRRWDMLAELLAQRIEVEGDDAEIGELTKKLARVLSDELDRGDEALAALSVRADEGDASIREAYLELGDRLGWRGIVATKLVEWWFDARPSAERTGHLRGAFERFAEVGRDEDAVRVACEIARSKGADTELAERLERLAVKTRDLDALSVAHDLLAREQTGALRAKELVRQAEVRVTAGAPRLEAIQHGEAGLTSVPPAEVEELLLRLSAIAEKADDVVDLYERQISRCKTPSDRVAALARAAQVADARGRIDRAKGFFDLALGGAPSDETLAILEHAARDGDAESDSDEQRLRRALCAAMAAGGQGARDGGRTRGALMRRAASMAHRDLDDVDQAFTLLGDALIAHVDTLTLDALEGLAREVTDIGRAEAALSRALAEVFDGPLVRLLLARRAKLRREELGDKPGAAGDLKKLHDSSPNDQAVLDELSALLTELGDYRALVQVYEDQILRGKDMAARAELARKVARMWEDHLSDPREAADAWRRVLRMKQGDPEATAGLDRAKSNMLKRPEGAETRPRSAPPAGAVTARVLPQETPPPSAPPESAKPVESSAAPPSASIAPSPSSAPLSAVPVSSAAPSAAPVPAQAPTAADAGSSVNTRATVPEVEEPNVHEQDTRVGDRPTPPSARAPYDSLNIDVDAPDDDQAEGDGHRDTPDPTLTRPLERPEIPPEARRDDDKTPEPRAPSPDVAGEHDVVIADDLAEIVDLDEGTDEDPPEESEDRHKRTVPPLLPRG